MIAPLDGAAPTAVTLGLSPWILPLIAIAAKRKEDAARYAGARRVLLAWLRARTTRRPTRAGTSRSTRAARRASRS
ncbi:MAG TPA: hypothetical protein VLX44_14965 [Xanthobacteraceae bacterium]|nr:hypothetical protein [Xanthobacteraceae bacterium]